MTTNDWTLIAVKGFGLYLLANAIFAIPHLLGLLCGVGLHWTSMFPAGEPGVTSESLQTEYATQFVAAFARLFIYGGIGFYCVSRKQAPALMTP